MPYVPLVITLSLIIILFELIYCVFDSGYLIFDVRLIFVATLVENFRYVLKILSFCLILKGVV